MRALLRILALTGLPLTVGAADFSYYMLSLSYTPNFCAEAGSHRNARECSAGARPFVVHGLPKTRPAAGPRSALLPARSPPIWCAPC
jgi:ribonuclease T2